MHFVENIVGVISRFQLLQAPEVLAVDISDDGIAG
jgi:hypothetical protein